MSNRRCLHMFLFALAMLAGTQCVWAQSSGTWSSTNPGIWSTPGNWVDGIFAWGGDSTAFFNAVEVPPAGLTVHVDSNSQTIGNLVFGDITPNGGWVLDDNAGTGYLYLSVSSGSPTITVNDLGVGNVVNIKTGFLTTQGLVKAGSGTLYLTGGAFAPSITGPTTVNAGTLKINTGNPNTLDAASALTVNGTLDLGGTSQASAGPVILNGSVINGTLVNSGGLTYDARSGSVSARLSESVPSSLTKTTTGTLTLTGINNYSGGTVLNAGTLVFGTVASIPLAGAIQASGGVLQFDIPLGSYPLGPGSISLTGATACGTLQASGPYAGAAAWLASGKITPASAGTLALTANEGAINMAGYAGLSLGAIGNVTYTGTLTPAGATYLLGGGTGTLTVTGGAGGLLAANTVTINGAMNMTGALNNSSGTIINAGDQEAVLSVTNNVDLGVNPTTITFNGRPGSHVTSGGAQVAAMGGMLQVLGAAGTLNDLTAHPIANPASFSGGFDIVDPARTFTIGNQNINNGVQVPGTSGTLKKAGSGTLLINQGSHKIGSLEVAGGTLTIVGTPASPTVLTVNGLGSGSKDGENICLRGNAGDVITVNVQHDATINCRTFCAQYKNDNPTYVNVSGNGKINGQAYYLGDLSDTWGHSGSAFNVTTLTDTAQLLTTIGTAVDQCLQIGCQGEGTLNMHDYSTVLTDKVWMSQWTGGYVNNVAYGSQGTLNMDGHSTFTCTTAFAGTGNFTTSDNWHNDGDTNRSTIHVSDNAKMVIMGYFRLGGQNDVAEGGGSGTHIATFDGNALPLGAANIAIAGVLELNQGSNDSFNSTFNVGGNAKATVGGNIVLNATNAAGGPSGGSATLNVYGTGTVTGALDLTVGYINPGGGTPYNVPATVNVGTSIIVVSGSPNFITGGGLLTPVATLAIAGNTTLVAGSSLNVFNNGASTLTGALNVGDATTNSTVNVTSNGSLTVLGATTLMSGSTVTLDSTGTLSLKAVTGGDIDTLVVGGNNSATATADSVSVGTLTIGAGSTLTINAIPGGPMAGGGFTAVPEPSTFAMLAMAALGLMAAAWRRRK